MLDHDTIKSGRLYGYRTYEDEKSPLDATIYPVLVELEVQLHKYEFCKDDYKSYVEKDGSYGVCAAIMTPSSFIQAVNEYTGNQ